MKFSFHDKKTSLYQYERKREKASLGQNFGVVFKCFHTLYED